MLIPFFAKTGIDILMISNYSVLQSDLFFVEIGGVHVQTVIALNNICKSYSAKPVLQSITLEVGKGEVFGIVGPNGAGKTTLIEIIEGLRKADSGSAIVLGRDIRTHAKEIKHRIGVLLQSTSIPEKAKVKEVLALFASFYDKTIDYSHISRMLELEEKKNEMIKSLSGGWKQRVSLALALINDPEIVFLDEPSMGLDPNARLEMWKMIHRMRDEGRTIIVTTHYMEEAEYLCDRIAVINSGKLIALDTPQQLIHKLGSGRTRMITFKASEHTRYETLSTLKQIVHVELTNGFVKLHTTDMDIALTELYRLSLQEGWLIAGLKLEDASMNDVFTKLTVKEEEAV